MRLPLLLVGTNQLPHPLGSLARECISPAAERVWVCVYSAPACKSDRSAIALLLPPLSLALVLCHCRPVSLSRAAVRVYPLLYAYKRSRGSGLGAHACTYFNSRESKIRSRDVAASRVPYNRQFRGVEKGLDLLN